MPDAAMPNAAGRGMVEVLHTAEVAAGWHATQRRKGEAAEP